MHSIFKRIPNFCLTSILLDIFNFDHRILLKLFSIIKDATPPKIIQMSSNLCSCATWNRTTSYCNDNASVDLKAQLEHKKCQISMMLEPCIIPKFQRFLSFNIRMHFMLITALGFELESLSFRGSFLWNTLDDSIKN